MFASLSTNFVFVCVDFPALLFFLMQSNFACCFFSWFDSNDDSCHVKSSSEFLWLFQTKKVVFFVAASGRKKVSTADAGAMHTQKFTEKSVQTSSSHLHNTFNLLLVYCIILLMIIAFRIENCSNWFDQLKLLWLHCRWNEATNSRTINKSQIHK